MYISKAPLRIGIAGGGTDIYPYTSDFGGAVLNVTINKFVKVSLTLIEEKQSTFIIKTGEKKKIFYCVLNQNSTSGNKDFELVCETCRYILYANKRLNQAIQLEIEFEENQGGGLGTSSALVVAIITTFNCWLDIESDPGNIAEMAYHIEREILGHAGGKQDQYTAAFGGLNLMEFVGDNVTVNPIELSKESIEHLASRLVLYNTGKLRISGEIIKDQQNHIINQNVQSLNSLHFIKKQAYELNDMFRRGQIDSLGEFLHEGWLHKKNTSQKISNNGIDQIYNVALASGATGGKVLGAGGGGYMLFFCPSDLIKERVSDALKSFDGHIVPFKFTLKGVEVYKI